MTTVKHLRIGTRMSLMAMAQAKKVARLLQEKFPDLSVELVGINSSGDKDKKTPLWQMNVVGIFSKELDEQLLAGGVDCNVHSFKDLGTQRPDGLKMGALLARDNPRDVILFRSDILQKIKNDEKIVIGTSAPRRMELLPEFLSQALPQLGSKPPAIKTIPLRGNVNSRIEKLKNKDGEHAPMDGIALGLGGLQRLYEDEIAHAPVADLLQDLKWMVMPLTICPTAPGQAVICVETTTNRTYVFELLQTLNDEDTARQVAAERVILVEQGGGCHQRFGATQINLPHVNGPITLIRGKSKDGVTLDTDLWSAPTRNKQHKNIWDGAKMRQECFETVKLSPNPVKAHAAFLAHARAMPETIDPATRLWVSGTASWIALAHQGYWVEGCADSFGIDFIQSTLKEDVLQLPAMKEWTIYTHEDAAKQWQDGHVVATYRLEPKKNDAMLQALNQADMVWWSSDSQYNAFGAHAKNAKLHCCGAGKTAEQLKAKGVTPLAVFPNHVAWKKWCDDNT